MSDPHDLPSLSATAAAEAIRSGNLTSVALVTACLDRIAAREPEIGAWALVDREGALAAAEAADIERRSGRGVGLLHGVPVAVKDIIDVAGLPTAYGLTNADRPPQPIDAAAVASLRAAGAVVLGKTATTELAMFQPAATRNPANLAHTAGGSSAGSAAAVADRHLPLAIGTQTAGSVIRPASYCGVHAFKPTRGLIPRSGVLMQSRTLDTLGVFGRSLADLALAVDVMSAYDPTDPASDVRGRPRLMEAVRQTPPLPPLIAYVPTPAFDSAAEPALADAFAELISILAPFELEQLETPSLRAAAAAVAIVQLAENAHHYGPLLDRGRAILSAPVVARIEEGRAIPAATYLAALEVRETAYAAVESILQDYAVILTPAAPGPAPTLDAGTTGSPVFNGLWTFLGCPCVTLPLLEADGLPIGVQLVGARGDDGRLLRTARWFEETIAAA